MGKGTGRRGPFFRSRRVNPARIVAAGFAAVIAVGTLLLLLPFASADGRSAGLLNSLFTATSATCVTGLVTLDTALSWSPFGQAVILVLIQLGGLGFMTILTLLSLLLHRRIGLSERLVMVSTFNLNDLDGVVRVVRHALMGTFALEGTAAVLLSVRFVPQFGLAGGIWRGVFHAVSAFCNAGFDLMGDKAGAFTSMEAYQNDPYVLGILMVLVVVGGLGFFVWEDLLRAKSWKGLSLYSKLVLSLTATLLLGGALFFFCAEYNNPDTLGPMPLGEKVLNALFQSVTLRTAGFASFDQGALQDGSMALSCIFMLIGGSSGSTAGGLKTVTAAVLLLGLRSSLAGREQVTLRGRAISYRKVLDAMTLALMMGLLFLGGSIVISLADGVRYVDAAFEAASALGTVGLTAGITPGLSPLSHGLIIAMMYLGRIGVLSFSIAFLTRGRDRAKIRYPEFDIMIG